MSRELATAFFERDLTPAETDALEASLQASPETAEALLAAAEANYRATGLPEPRWSDRRPTRFGKGWLLVAVLLGGGALWALNTQKTSAHVYDVIQVEGELPVVDFEPIEAAEAEVEAQDAAEPTARPAKSAAKVVEKASRQGNRLGVVLRLKEAQNLTVQIFDAQEKPVRLIFEGHAQAGERRYEWDGLDAQGKRLPAGNYQVRVSGPGIALTRPLSLRAQTK